LVSALADFVKTIATAHQFCMCAVCLHKLPSPSSSV